MRTGTGLIQMFPNIASPAVSLPLEESGQLDNILIFYCSDNGASGEGSPNGS
jgi:hypothetical protein